MGSVESIGRLSSVVCRRSMVVGRPSRLNVVTFLRMSHPLKYRVLRERLAVCRMAADAPVPGWAAGSGFYCATRTSDELSIVCPENRIDQSSGDVTVEGGWIAIKLEGPFPFSMTGVLSSFLQPLAEAQIPIFAISTFDTDYVLVKEENLPRALAALRAAGHEALGRAVGWGAQGLQNS